MTTTSQKKSRVLLLGDSTVLGSVPRLIAPKADHLEDVIRKLAELAPGGGLAVEVINKGQDNDTIQRMLATRYNADAGKLAGGPVDLVFIRFGLNDRSYLKDWSREFPHTYHELIARLRRDQPAAEITLETVIPYRDEASTREINDAVRAIAAAESLSVLDTHAHYAAALTEQGKNALNYRRAELADVPEPLRVLVPREAIIGTSVVVLDNLLDAHFLDVKGWFTDRHPNLAGFHVIGQCVAGRLVERLRARTAKP